MTPRARIVKIALVGQRFPYRAGQALMLGTHGHGTRRPYSIAAAPHVADRDDNIELLISVDALGSPGPHLTLEPEALVDVEGPVGRFTFPANPEERRLIFIAGGTGIAPLRAMLQDALNIPHREIRVLYSAQTPEDFAYERELRDLAREGRIQLLQTVTRDATAKGWTGTRGRIGRDELASLSHEPSTLYFICGPRALVAEMHKLLEGLDVPPQRIRTEDWLRPTATK